MSLFSIAPRNMFDPDYHRNTMSNNSVMKLHNDIDTVFNSVMDGVFGTSPFKAVRGMFMPSLDLHADEKQYVATCELPGVDPDAVTITVDDGRLVIKGEKKVEFKEKEAECCHSECAYGCFERVITLPEDIDTDQVTAASRHGVLTICIPRKPAEKAGVRQIAIQKDE